MTASNNTGASKQAGDTEPVRIAVLLPLAREMAGAMVLFADQCDIEDGQVNRYGFKCSIARIPALNRPGHFHRVALAIPIGTGNTQAAICVTQLRHMFNDLNYLIVCGIAGGAPTAGKDDRDIFLGDVVVAGDSGIVQYDSGHYKLTVGTPGVPQSSDERVATFGPNDYSMHTKHNLRSPSRVFVGLASDMAYRAELQRQNEKRERPGKSLRSTVLPARFFG